MIAFQVQTSHQAGRLRTYLFKKKKIGFFL